VGGRPCPAANGRSGQADLAHWLVDNIASPYSVNRLTGYLKSLGHNAPKSAVSDYLAWFEDAGGRAEVVACCKDHDQGSSGCGRWTGGAMIGDMYL